MARRTPPAQVIESAARGYTIGMSTHSKKRVHHLRVRWGLEVGVAIALVIAAIVCLALVRGGTLDSRPWSYIAVAVAILAAFGAMILTIVEGFTEGNVPDNLDDLE